MAEFVLDNPRVFPDGTEVGAYPASNWTTPVPAGEPTGTATQTVTVASGKATFTELTEGVAYWAVAKVGAEYRYVAISVWAPPVEAAQIQAQLEAGAEGVALYDAETEEWEPRPSGFKRVVYVSKVHGTPDPTDAEEFDEKKEPPA